MAKLSPPKKASKPTAPKKPTSRSKTGNAACSSAASNWQLALRGKAALDPETYRTLAKCRAMSRTAKMAEAQGRTGKLSAMGESAVKARLQSRFDSGLITHKSRTEKLNALLKQRAERGKVATPKASEPAALPEKPWLATPTPARYSLGGKLAPGRGTEERFLAAKFLKEARSDLATAQKKISELGKEPQKPSAENRFFGSGGRQNASPEVVSAYDSSQRLHSAWRRKYSEAKKKEVTASNILFHAMRRKKESRLTVKRKAAQGVTEVVAKPATTAPTPPKYSLGGQLAPGRGTEKRKSRVSLKMYERNQKNAQRAYTAGAIPLADKAISGADDKFVATIFEGGSGKFVRAIKTVKGADRAAVQIESVRQGGKYGIVDPVSGFGAGLNYKKQAEAEQVAKRMDRLTKRASREQGNAVLSLNDVSSGKGGSRYQELLKSMVRRELRKSGQLTRASQIR